MNDFATWDSETHLVVQVYVSGRDANSERSLHFRLRSLVNVRSFFKKSLSNLGSELPSSVCWSALVSSCCWFIFEAFWPFVYSGNVNGASVNNRNSNGNYWSASGNNSNNAYNLNFNSSNVNPGTNNNNKYNGRMVRCLLGS